MTIEKKWLTDTGATDQSESVEDNIDTRCMVGN